MSSVNVIMPVDTGDNVADNLKPKETVIKYLAEHYTMTIATVRGSAPWAASVFYASDGLILYFLSDSDSRHSKDIEKNSLVAVTVNEDYQDWRQIKGIQMEGKAEMVITEDEIASATTAYAEKYPFTAVYLKLMSTPFPKVVKYLERFLSKLPSVPAFTTAVSHRFYKVMPVKVRFIDNEKSFGHNEEFTL